MSPRYDSEWIARLLDGEERFGGADPREMLAAEGIAEGHAVVDYGCGPGYLTLAAAELVGAAGMVYAVDLEPSMVDLVSRRAADAGFSNVGTAASNGVNAPAPDGAADFVICALIMHYQETREERVAVVRDAARLLRPGGKAVFVQWKSEGGRSSGVTFDSLADIAAEAGLAIEGPYHVSDAQYKAIARKEAGN